MVHRIPAWIRMLILLFSTIAILPTKSMAQGEPAEQLASADELEELLSIIEEETDIATKTKVNADFVPGLVTVLYGSEAESLGARTVWEALSLVPGVQIQISNVGIPLVLIRGAGASFTKGQVKVLLNSISMNSSDDGFANNVINLPIEMVDRIEVIRGPGATIYGEFAYLGVINVITKQEGNQLFGSLAQYSTWNVGGMYHWTNSEGTLSIGANVSVGDSDGADRIAGPDQVAQIPGPNSETSFSPGPAGEDEGQNSYILTLDYKDFSLKFQSVDSEAGRFFGIAALPPPSDDKFVEDATWVLDAEWKWDIRPSLKSNLYFLLMEHSLESNDHIIFPPGFRDSRAPGMPFFPEGLFLGDYYKERRIQGGGDFVWSGWKNQEWLLEISQSRVEVVDGYNRFNADIRTGMPFHPPMTIPPAIPIGTTRDIFGFTLQDTVGITDKFNVTAGFRYDYYSDAGDKISPRISAVYRLSESHLLKAQYAEAFRPPTIQEIHSPLEGFGRLGNPNLKPETIATTEGSYVYKKAQTTGRVTVFYSRLRDLVVGDRPPRNLGRASLKGLELEWEQQFMPDIKLLANVSYADARDDILDHALEGTANWVFNVSVLGRIGSNLLVAPRWLHVGPRNRASLDRRDKLKGYDSVDLTATYQFRNPKGLQLRAGVKNLFDDEIIAPAPLGPTGNPTIVGDLPRPGVTWWTQVKYSF